MKKNIEWLKEKVQKRIDKLPGTYSGLYIEGSRDAYHLALKDIDQLDEPEVLSDKWITENSVEGDFRGVQEFWYGEFIEKEKVENLLVPKQELPVIPKFVAYVIEAYKSNSRLTNLLADLAFHGGLAEFVEHEDEDEVFEWARSNRKATDEILARAWLYGYEVEEEQKYVVPVGENHALCKFTNDAWGIYKEDIDKLYLDDDFKFTEQEIKDYDERYLAFKVPVEEME